MGDNYYKLKQYVSNSDLNALRVALGWKIQIKGDKEKAYSFGNLIDALITEPGLINADYRAVVAADGTFIEFDLDTWNKAQAMRNAALSHPTIKMILGNMEFQLVVKHEAFRIESPVAAFHMPVRIKMDGCAQKIKTGMDLKSTAAKTDKAFRASLDTFDYDQQCAWYMDIAGLDFFWFVGVGKEALRNGTYPVFLFAVTRGDEFYESGRAKYQDIAEQYHRLILGLDYEMVINRKFYQYETGTQTDFSDYEIVSDEAIPPGSGLDAAPWE